jgi:hypothetical protein
MAICDLLTVIFPAPWYVYLFSLGYHDRQAWTNKLYRHQTLYVSFSLSQPVNRLCGILFNRFYRPEIHSLMVGIFDPAYELLPPWMKELCLCTVPFPLYLLSDLLPPPFSNKMYIIYRQCVPGVGGC